MDQLSQSERDLAFSGSLVAEIAVYRGRLKRGNLNKDQLRVAAFLENEAAIAILGDERPDIPEELSEWAQKLFDIGGLQVVTKAAVIAARQVLPFWENFHDSNDPRQAIDAAENWVCEPTLENAALARRAAALNEIDQQLEDFKHDDPEIFSSPAVIAAIAASATAYSAALFERKYPKHATAIVYRAIQDSFVLAEKAASTNIKNCISGDLNDWVLNTRHFAFISKNLILN